MRGGSRRPDEVARQHEHGGELGELRRLADLVAADREPAVAALRRCPPRCRPRARAAAGGCRTRRAPAPATPGCRARSGRPAAAATRPMPIQTSWRNQTPAAWVGHVGLPRRVEHQQAEADQQQRRDGQRAVERAHGPHRRDPGRSERDRRRDRPVSGRAGDVPGRAVHRQLQLGRRGRRRAGTQHVPAAAP